MALNLDRVTSRRRTRAAWGLLALTAAAALAAALSWRTKLADNALIAAGEVAVRRDLEAALDPALRFAQARELAAREQHEAALARYRTLHGDPAFGVAARYNSANLLMRQGLVLMAQERSAGQAVAFVELAKQGYREVLRAEPGHWDARYNLERAQRLQPDPEDATPSIAEPRNDAERASTKSRGIDPGLP
jgi:mxaK protein